MDKQSFGNYGALVAIVIVVALMISFATPFGNHIIENIKNTVIGVGDAGGGALDNMNTPMDPWNSYNVIGKWVFQDRLSTVEFDVYVNFTYTENDGTVRHCNRIVSKVNGSKHNLTYYYPDGTFGGRYDPYVDGDWEDDFLKTITVISSSTESAFDAWLNGNAAKQVLLPAGVYVFKDRIVSVLEEITAEQWYNGDYNGYTDLQGVALGGSQYVPITEIYCMRINGSCAGYTFNDHIEVGEGNDCFEYEDGYLSCEGEDASSNAEWCINQRTIVIPEDHYVSQKFYQWFTQNTQYTSESQNGLIGKWTFNEAVDFDSLSADLNIYFRFFSNGFEYINIWVNHDGNTIEYTATTGEELEMFGGSTPSWYYDEDRTVVILTEPQDAAFVEWLQANATKQ